MKNAKLFILFFVVNAAYFQTDAQNISFTSPDKNISVTIDNGDKLSYLVQFNERVIVNPSQLGFELKDEPSLDGKFMFIDQNIERINEIWKPAVKSKHAKVLNNCNELQLLRRAVYS